MELRNQMKFAKQLKLSAREQNYTFWLNFFFIKGLIDGKLSGMSMRKLTRFILQHKQIGEDLKDKHIRAASENMRRVMNENTIDADKNRWKEPNEDQQAVMWAWFDDFTKLTKQIGAKHYAEVWGLLQTFEENAIKAGKAMSQDAIIEEDTERGLYHSPSTEYLRGMALDVLRSLKEYALTIYRLQQEMEINKATAKRLGLIIAPLVTQGIVTKHDAVEHGKKTTAYTYCGA